MKATWNNKVIASSDDTIVIEGNHYFPPESVDRQYLKENDQKTTCIWKGESSYYDLVDDDEVANAAAWYYPNPTESAFERTNGQDFSNYVAFYPNIVDISE